MDWNEAFGELRERLSAEALDEESALGLWQLVFRHQREDLARFAQEWLPYLSAHDTYDPQLLFDGSGYLREEFEDLLPWRLTNAYPKVSLYLGWSVDLGEALASGAWVELEEAARDSVHLILDVQDSVEGRAYRKARLILGVEVHSINSEQWEPVVDPQEMERALEQVYEELPPSCERLRHQPLQMLLATHGRRNRATLMRGIVTDGDSYGQSEEEIDAYELLEELEDHEFKDKALGLFLRFYVSEGDEALYDEALAFQRRVQEGTTQGRDLEHPLFWEDEELGVDQDWEEFFVRLSKEPPHPTIEKLLVWKTLQETTCLDAEELDLEPGWVRCWFDGCSSNEWDSTHIHRFVWGHRWFEAKGLRWNPALATALDHQLEASLRAQIEEEELDEVETFEFRWLLVYDY